MDGARALLLRDEEGQVLGGRVNLPFHTCGFYRHLERLTGGRLFRGRRWGWPFLFAAAGVPGLTTVISFVPMGEPRPVQASQPGPALKPTGVPE